jgi:aminobenzoyl-glutamate utilization protein B
MYENINNIGLPDWSENDQKLAIAVQKEVNSSNTSGLATIINKIGSPLPIFISGGSDDIGDISWKVPTVTLRFPSNIPGLQGHHWSNSIAMATPIAHKGANAGAKVLAMTILDFLLKPEKLTQAKDYFENVQKEETEYRPMISENDPPATFLNKDIMEQYKSRLKEFYFDETKYETYLQQLGIDYPVIKD